MSEMKNDMKKIEDKLNNMTQSIDTLQNSLNILLDTMRK